MLLFDLRFQSIFILHRKREPIMRDFDLRFALLRRATTWNKQDSQVGSTGIARATLRRVQPGIRFLCHWPYNRSYRLCWTNDRAEFRIVSCFDLPVPPCNQLLIDGRGSMDCRVMDYCGPRIIAKLVNVAWKVSVMFQQVFSSSFLLSVDFKD